MFHVNMLAIFEATSSLLFHIQTHHRRQVIFLELLQSVMHPSGFFATFRYHGLSEVQVACVHDRTRQKGNFKRQIDFPGFSSGWFPEQIPFNSDFNFSVKTLLGLSREKSRGK